MVTPSLATLKSLWFKTELELRIAALESDLYIPAYVLLTAQKHGRVQYRDFCIQFTDLLRQKFSLVNYSWSEPLRKQVRDEMVLWLAGVSNENKLLVMITSDLEDVQQFLHFSTRVGKILDSLDIRRIIYLFLYIIGFIAIFILFVDAKFVRHFKLYLAVGLFFISGLSILDRFGPKKLTKRLLRRKAHAQNTSSHPKG